MTSDIKKARSNGFTLVEMAVVIVIIGLLISISLSPYSVQRDLRDISGTQASLKQITDALYGFAILKERLPCPSTETNPANSNYGYEDPTCSSPTSEGYLPWKTLGVNQTDEWGTPRTQSTDSWKGYWRYRVDRNFATTTNFASYITSTSPVFGDTLSVKDGGGNLLTSTTDRPIAIVYSTGKNLTADGENSSYETTGGTYQSDTNSSTFDDILIWIGRPAMVGKLVAAGKLP